MILIGVTQHALLHLAGRTQRNAVDEDHVVGRPPAGDLAVVELKQFVARDLGARGGGEVAVRAREQVAGRGQAERAVAVPPEADDRREDDRGQRPQQPA